MPPELSPAKTRPGRDGSIARLKTPVDEESGERMLHSRPPFELLQILESARE
jgi:hypothetical protein